MSGFEKKWEGLRFQFESKKWESSEIGMSSNYIDDDDDGDIVMLLSWLEVFVTICEVCCNLCYDSVITFCFYYGFYKWLENN